MLSTEDSTLHMHSFLPFIISNKCVMMTHAPISFSVINIPYLGFDICNVDERGNNVVHKMDEITKR